MPGFQHEVTIGYSSSKIRAIIIVVDLEDPFFPELTIEDFVKRTGKQPELPRYRILRIETVTCCEDGQPILVSECARCPRFIARSGDSVYCRTSGKVL